MKSLLAEARKAANARTYVLAGVLVLALAWAVAERAAPKPRPGRAPASAAAAAQPSAPLAEPTPAGWGRDPFDPRAVSADMNAKGR